MLYLVLALFGVLSGVTTVLFGFGGGFVAVPVLYAALRGHAADDPAALAAMHIAVATSTCVMIVNAAAATRRHQKAGNILRAYVWPLAGYIAVGAALGALAAMRIDGGLVRLAFIAYLAVTLADCLLRQGFLAHDGGGQPRPLGGAATAGGGLAIGAVAAFLGGRQRDDGAAAPALPMAQAAAMANPLTLPVAVAGTLAYVVAARDLPAGLAPWMAGYVDLPAFALLSLGSLVGIRLGAPLIPRIPDRLHARAYLLLALVLLGMLA